MAISIKGVNTGVIRKSNNFIALALKIKEPRNKESLFFMSVMELRDLLIALESRLHQKHKLDAAAHLQYEQARDKVIKKMAENIPEILVDELKNADINRRVNTLELTDNQGENLTFVLTLHDGSKCELVVNELQIEMLARAIIHAINNAEMRELALRITSLLDFLPLYDVDCGTMAIWNMTPIPNRNGNITCSTIIWRCFTALKMKVAKNNLAAQW